MADVIGCGEGARRAALCIQVELMLVWQARAIQVGDTGRFFCRLAAAIVTALNGSARDSGMYRQDGGAGQAAVAQVGQCNVGLFERIGGGMGL